MGNGDRGNQISEANKAKVEGSTRQRGLQGKGMFQESSKQVCSSLLTWTPMGVMKPYLDVDINGSGWQELELRNLATETRIKNIVKAINSQRDL